MPEHIIERVRGFTPNLYLSLSFQTMVKFKVKRVFLNVFEKKSNGKPHRCFSDF